MTSFPKNFIWGVATSSYQIEGAVDVDGRGESIWDRFCTMPGAIEDGSTGRNAVDHYHRWPQDIALMQELGIGAYRFSIAWTRVIPNGTGSINHRGLDFYDRLIDSLLEAGIVPLPTLYHWDLPQALEDAGGWPARDTAMRFVDFTEAVVDRLGDRAPAWITHNEPYCTAFLGYQTGVHAPGRKDWRAALAASHHVLLSHGLAAQVIKEAAPNSDVGIAINFEPADPKDDLAASEDAARIWNGYFHRWFLDPLFGKGYPGDMVGHYTEAGYLPEELDFVEQGDMETIAADLDFLGVNYYTRHLSDATETLDQPASVHVPDAEYTAMGWEVRPEALQRLLAMLTSTYGPRSILITENGCSYLDEPDETGRIKDDRRIDYLQQHLGVIQSAISQGVPVIGYLQWSLLDNFEWSRGYLQRFGAVHVDFDSQVRRFKDSAYWYRNVIESNSL